jgi:RNA polymerase sigma-70 factor, ECF subfamily
MGPALSRALDPVDVLQEAYLEAHRSFARFEPRGEGAFLAWMYRVVDHRLSDLADHHGALKRRPPGERVEGSRALERLRASSTGPVGACARHEVHGRLIEAIDALEPQAREAVLLRFFHGRTLDEVAQALETSERSIRRLLADAQHRIGEQLRAFGDGA